MNALGTLGFAPPLPLFTTADAATAHLRLGSAHHVRLRRGVWAEAAPYRQLPGWRRYEARVAAFTLRHPDAVLCAESAAVLHGLPLIGECRDIHVYDPEARTTRRFGDILVHTSLAPREVCVRSGVAVTSLDETVTELLRELPLAHALAVADAAASRTRVDATDVTRLRDAAAQQSMRRGVRRVRWVLERVDPSAESAVESISRAVIDVAGFESPDTQVEYVTEGHRDRVDFGFAASGVIGEADGWAKYALGDPATAAVRLRDEKRREDRLRRAGFTVARWEWRDAIGVTPLCRILDAAGTHRVRPPQHALLATLTRNPRAT